MRNRTIITILLALAALTCAFCLCVFIIGGVTLYQFSQEPEIQAIYNELAATPTPTPAPQINRDPLILMEDVPSTAELLAQTEVPVRDLRLLASRLKFRGRHLPATVNDAAVTYEVGQEETFWISDDTGPTPRQFQTTATLRHITEHTYWWVENGFRIDLERLKQSAEIFETQTYPTNHAFFGTEWTPGVDNDVHLSIFLGNVPGVGGYFASLNEFSGEVNPYSNEREMFFINLNALSPGDADFDSVLAHEFQHMIHWHQDRNEETWINEGLSELAAHLNGYTADGHYNLYLSQPDLQLTTWAHQPRATLPHYGSSYLFMVYFLEQFGEDTLKAVVAAAGNGIQGINQGLKAGGHQQTFDDIFADFVVANYLHDASLAQGQWGYQDLSLTSPNIDAVHTGSSVKRETTVRQYGVDYIELRTEQPFTLHFTGSTSIQVVDNQAHSGRYQWYSNRGDDSNATLTRSIDLSSVSSATLNYWAWFDIEEDWDYAYLEVSTDQGNSWTIIETPGSRNTNPSGNAYGPGYTGKSAGWLQESVDLSAYAGQQILLRFEYVTDDAVNGPGLTIDDVSIPEIGFFDDMESPDSAWVAAGFIRMDNLLKQQFTVQLITPGDQPAVSPIPLDDTNLGQLTIDGAEAERFILVVTAQAPVTTEPASYEYAISQAR